MWQRCRRSTSPGSFNHGTSTHGVSRCNAQFVSDNGHVLQSGQSDLRRVRDFPVDQKRRCFVEAPGPAAVSYLGFRFLAFPRKADRRKPQWIQWTQEPEAHERSLKGRLPPGMERIIFRLDASAQSYILNKNYSGRSLYQSNEA